MSSALLRLSDACARRGAFDLGPLSLEVARGEVVALLGPNGAGKSTVLALACGELRPRSGECLLLGDPPAALPRVEAARRVAQVRQAAPPRLPMTAEDLATHGRWAHLSGLRFPGEPDRAIVREALERCGALALAARDIRTLSGGEMQRVLLAKALAQESPLLLLDEPTSNLDLAQRARVLALVRELVSGGARGALVVSHDMDLAAGLCDRVAIMAAGRILAVGSPEEALRADILTAAHGWPVLVDRHPGTGRVRVTPEVHLPPR